MTILSIVLSIIICYLLGSITFGTIISKKLLKEDVRTVGSGGAGMTNVLRNYGKAPAIFTAIGDFLKGVVAVFIAKIICVHLGGLDPNIAGYIGAYSVLLGHAFPVFFQFRGGKCVMTGIASLIMLDWICAIAVLAVFLIIIATTRYMSLGSMLGAVTFPIASLVLKRPFFPNIIGSVGVAAFVVFLHRGNISRLIKGTEPKLGSKKNKQDL